MTIDFGAACRDLFKGPNMWMTVLGLFVCTFIPVAGPMIAWGFLLRRYAKVREGKEIEDFDFNLFGDYLKIGLWPVLASLLLSLLLVPLIFVFMIPVFFGAMLAEGDEVWLIVSMLVGSLLYCGVIFGFVVFMYPVMLRSGLMMDFKAGFHGPFVFGFVRRVGWSLFGYYLLIVLISFPLMIVGYLALIVGVYVVAVWIQVVMTHLTYQHYDLYLERGGEPIPIHPDVTADRLPPALPPRPGPEPPGLPRA